MKRIYDSLFYLLIYYCTFGYVMLSLVGAHFPDLTLASTVLRDFWMLPAVLMIILGKHYRLLLFLVSSLSIAGIGVLFDPRLLDIFVFMYGFRDIIFIATVVMLLKIDAKQFGSVGLMQTFVLACLGLSSLELFLQAAERRDFVDALFQYRQYFEGKGVVSNISGGIFGNRLVAPLYSASLVGVLYTLFAFFVRKNLLVRGSAIAVAFFSLSKVIPIIIFYGLMKRYAKIGSLALVVIIIILYPVFSYIIDVYSMTVYSQHASSILDRYNVFTVIFAEGFGLRPWPLGYWSVYGHLIAGLDGSAAPESLLIARIMDFGFAAIIPFAFLAWSCRGIKVEYQAFIILFFTLQLLSSLNNHLVAFVPIIVLMKKAGGFYLNREASRSERTEPTAKRRPTPSSTEALI